MENKDLSLLGHPYILYLFLPQTPSISISPFLLKSEFGVSIIELASSPNPAVGIPESKQGRKLGVFLPPVTRLLTNLCSQ